MANKVKLPGGKTAEFESENDLLLFMACTLTYMQFSNLYKASTGKNATLKMYRERTTPESRVKFLNLAAQTLVSDGTYLIDLLPGARAKLESIS